MATTREKVGAALAALGETMVKKLKNYEVWTRKSGGRYYLGRAGAVRVGARSPGIPASHRHAADLEDLGAKILSDRLAGTSKVYEEKLKSRNV